MLPLFLLLCASVCSAVHLLLRENWTRVQIAEIFFSYLLFFCVGIMGLLGFYGHAFMSDAIAQKIGWPTGSPFQLEIASANLAFGVIGVLCLFYRDLFWLATGLSFSIFALGDLCVHLKEFAKGNNAPYNIGMLVWVEDFIVPVLLLSLIVYLFYMRKYEY